MPPIDNAFAGEDDDDREPDDPQFQPPADPTALARACEGDGRSVQAAWRHLRADADSDAQLSEDSPGERARQQAVLTILAGLPRWMVRDGMIRALSVVSDDTSEHVVYRASDRYVLKATMAGWYGQIPVVIDGRLSRVPATPAQYLDRICLYNVVFNGEVKLLGFCVSDRPSLIIGEPPGQPSIVVVQPFYVAADPNHPTPSLAELDRLMRALSFLPVRNYYYGWIRLKDGIIVVDARPDNFVLTEDAVIPIDLQIAQVDPELLRQIVVD